MAPNLAVRATGAAAPSRNTGLDALRAIACAMVILFHLNTVGGVSFGPLDPLIGGGDTGVFVFFVLSGYLLYRPFLWRDPDLPTYAIRRAARIIPGYFVALACLVILTGNPLPAAHPLPYLTMSASYSIPLRGFLGSAWTLSAEIVFYVTLPLIARLAAGREWRVLGALAAISAILATWQRLTISTDTEWLLGTFPFMFYAFVPGMAVALIERSHRAVFARLASPRWLAIGINYIAFGMLTSILPVGIGSTIGGAIVVAWLLQHEVSGARSWAFLGGMSYAAYLWHKDLIIAFGPAGAVIALVGAAASWTLVERPILRWAHARRPSLAGHREPGPTDATAGRAGATETVRP